MVILKVLLWCPSLPGLETRDFLDELEVTLLAARAERRMGAGEEEQELPP